MLVWAVGRLNMPTPERRLTYATGCSPINPQPYAGVQAAMLFWAAARLQKPTDA